MRIKPFFFAIGGYRALAPLSALALLALTLSGAKVWAQNNYLLQAGSPTFATKTPVELGSVNLANGNLHLEIPMASPPERGSIRFAARLMYDSRICAASVGNGVFPDHRSAGSTTWRTPRKGRTRL